MSIFKNHRGQFHKKNTALVALTAIYVVGAAVAVLSPYWASSVPILAPLAAFAATPLGMGILAIVAVALIWLAVYAIIQNNKISELKAPRITKDELVVRRDVYEEMKKNNQLKDDNGNVKLGQYYIDFSLEGKSYRVIIVENPIKTQGNLLSFGIDSLSVKNNEGKYVSVSDISKKFDELGLKEKSGEINTYLGELSIHQPAASQEKTQ